MSVVVPNVIIDAWLRNLRVLGLIAMHATKYLSIIHHELERLGGAELRDLMSAIEVVRDYEPSLRKTGGDSRSIEEYRGNTIGLLVAVSGVYDVVHVRVDRAVETIARATQNPFLEKSIKAMSSTYRAESVELERILREECSAYSLRAALIDEDIYWQMHHGLSFGESMGAVYEYIIGAEFSLNRFTRIVMAEAMRVYPAAQHMRLVDIVEGFKMRALGSGRIALSRPGIEGMIVRGGLRPVGHSVPLSTILAGMGIECGPGSAEDNIKSAVERTGYGVVVLCTGVGTITEFQIEGLVDQAYIANNDLKTAERAGLNSRLLRRFNTLETRPGISRADMTRRYAGRADEWYVLETIEDGLYRVLGFGGHTGPHPSRYIASILCGVNTRPHIYNSLQAQIIMSRCFDLRARGIYVTYEDAKKTKRLTEISQKKLVEKILGLIEDRISSARYTDDLFAAVTRDVVRDGLVAAMPSEQSMPDSEHILSYVARIDGLTIVYIRELERQRGNDQYLRGNHRIDGRAERISMVDSLEGVLVRAAQELDRAQAWTDYNLGRKEYVLERKDIVI